MHNLQNKHMSLQKSCKIIIIKGTPRSLCMLGSIFMYVYDSQMHNHCDK